MTEIAVHVVGYPDTDAEERAELAWRLQEDLLEADVEDVSRRPLADAPEGAKGGAVAWAELLVTVTDTLPAFATAILGWLGRHPGAAIKLQADGDAVTLDATSAQERRELLEVFLRRHGGD